MVLLSMDLQGLDIDPPDRLVYDMVYRDVDAYPWIW